MLALLLPLKLGDGLVEACNWKPLDVADGRATAVDIFPKRRKAKGVSNDFILAIELRETKDDASFPERNG
jgi:hypothetical protein